MTKREKAEVWRSRIDRKMRERQRFFEGIKDADGKLTRAGADFGVEAYRGNTQPDWWNCRDPWIHIGKVKSSIRANLPSLLYSNPEYKVWPAAHDIDETGVDVAYERSRAKAAWLNHIYGEANGNTHVRVAIQNSFFSYGVIKGGYRCHFQDDDRRGVFARDENGEYILDESGDPTLERGEFLMTPEGEIDRDADGIPLLHPGRLTKEHWFIEVVDPKMMLFDTEAGPDFKQHRYVIEEWLRPLEHVRNDPRFPKARRERVVATETVFDAKGSYQSPFAGDSQATAVENDEARVRGWDIYDFEEDEYLVLTDSGTGQDEFLLDGPMPQGMEHGPYRFLKLTEDVGYEWYPIPDAIDMALVNQEYDVKRSQENIHREHTKSRYLVRDGTFAGEGVDPEEEMAKLTNGPDGTCLRVVDQTGIVPMQKAYLDPSFQFADAQITRDFNEVAGLPGEVRGVADADTATQASILASSAETRNNDRRDNLVQVFLSEIGRMLLISGQANAELDTLVIQKVIEQEGVPPFKAIKVSREELIGEFAVDVAIGSTMAKNDPRTLNQVMNLLNAFGQNPGIGMYKGLIRRVVDGLGLDPMLAEEIYQVSESLVQQMNAPQQGENPPGDVGQTLQAMLGGTANAAGGAQTGAPATMRGYQ